MTEYSLPVWKWPMTGPYNGFTGEERIRGWQVQHFLIKVGELPNFKDLICSVCGANQRVGMHCEDYYRPWKILPACQKCHGAIHRRYQSPHLYENMVRAYAKSGGEWFVGMDMTGSYDLARELREEFGEEIRWFPALPIPSGITFPKHQLHPLDRTGSDKHEAA